MRLTDLCIQVRAALSDLPPNEPIWDCGHAVVSILSTRPEEVIELAQGMLHAWPYRDVPVCWRRAFEEGSLWRVLLRLETRDEESSEAAQEPRGKKRARDGSLVIARDNDYDDGHATTSNDWLTDIVEILDRALILTGAPMRRTLINTIMNELAAYAESSDLLDYKSLPTSFSQTAKKMRHDYQKTFIRFKRPTLETFQHHLDTATTPLIMTDVLSDWPATSDLSHAWSNPQYLYTLTLGGRRLVPVELGRSYTDSDWGQKIMPFSTYLRTYLLDPNPKQTGYLAQHDLLEQIPCLSADTMTPDYCYTSPPPPPPESAVAPQPELEAPLRNAWLGPAGTVSPLHTDPYHNILCQVVGRKYVRLYPPGETKRVYPRGVDETGVSMENTSSVDVGLARKLFETEHEDMDGASEDEAENDLDQQKIDFESQFPGFKDAEFMEGVLEEGECLYIPVGWWHYIESLETSFNVSYWWN